MASALSILFLGCWLAGQSGARGEPRVSISASPGEVIAPGGALTIRCCCRFGGRLFLYKDGAEFRELYPAGDGGEFTIRSARQEDAGSYSCESRAGWWLFQWAYDSDTLHISVAETYYPKPSISLRPSRRVALGGAVNIWCWGGPQNMRFLLSKEGTLHALQEVEPARDVAGFPIRNVSRQDAGSYRCYYRTPWDPAVRSRPSDPVELVVAGEGPGSASPPPAGPSGGRGPDGTLRGGLCPCPDRERAPSRWGVPRQAATAAAADSGLKEAGIPAPGGAAGQRVFPKGLLPQTCPLGTHRSQVQGLPSHPQP
ncbi:leukocyte immunoglobulin-like receptor subfamily B member 2 [Pelodiscus sinensis]|uniref:leukocyte immunoglobulin-like receptor subfamily B member 2 n=1 Tax=Pelodiscus sinensis TaxID=13735 RepID=UPI003F6AA433